jgi:hypothetical protein
VQTMHAGWPVEPLAVDPLFGWPIDPWVGRTVGRFKTCANFDHHFKSCRPGCRCFSKKQKSAMNGLPIALFLYKNCVAIFIRC